MSIERKQVGARMSQIVIHGDTVYLAGQVGIDAAGESPCVPITLTVLGLSQPGDGLRDTFDQRLRVDGRENSNHPEPVKSISCLTY